MEDLKRNRQALTATVFQEGRPVGFEDNVLTVEFPADSDFHAAEARKSRHGDALGDIIEEHFGVRPRLNCRLAGGPSETLTPAREEPQREASSRTTERGSAIGLETNREEPSGRATGPAEIGETSRSTPDESEAANGPSAPAQAGTAPDAAGLDDRIVSEGEVFEMARERGLFGQNGGS